MLDTFTTTCMGASLLLELTMLPSTGSRASKILVDKLRVGWSDWQSSTSKCSIGWGGNIGMQTHFHSNLWLYALKSTQLIGLYDGQTLSYAKDS